MYGIERRFGIEIEAHIPNMSLAHPDNYGNDRQKLSASLTRALGWSPSDDGWKIKGDGSIRNEAGNQTEGGFEYTSPPLDFTQQNLIKVRDFVDCLQTQGAKVNKSCGLHVHMDMSGENNDTVARFWDRYALLEDEIDAGVESSRRKDRAYYCRSIKVIHSALDMLHSKFTALAKKDISRTEYLSGILLPKLIYNDKYRKVSPRYFYHPLGSMKTVEVRHHHGSLEGKEVSHWVAWCQTMFEASKTADTEKDKNDFYFKLPDRVSEVWKERPGKYPDRGENNDSRVHHDPSFSYLQDSQAEAADAYVVISSEDAASLNDLYTEACEAYRRAQSGGNREYDTFIRTRDTYYQIARSTPGGRTHMRNHRF
jgi:hypothetical protein